MSSLESQLVQAAMEYAGYGWHVVPVKPRGKMPVVGKGWQNQATNNEEQIGQWWTQTPLANVGILLGEKSGIVDFEGDGPDADRTMSIIFGEDLPVTPTFQSSRGKHRIFQYRSGLPAPDKNHFKIGDLEIRTGNAGKGAQSVFPPSIHESGVQYKWLIPPGGGVTPAEISDELMARLWNWHGTDLSDMADVPDASKSNEYWSKIAEGVAEGGRNQAAAEYIGKMLRDISDPFDSSSIERLWLLMTAWNDKNKPPLEIKELSTVFKSILQRHRQNVTDGEYKGKVGGRGFGAAEEWRLVIVNSQPVSYRLYSPLWSHAAKGGYITLTAADYRSPEAIGVEAVEQARVWLTGQFIKLWKGDKDNTSLAGRLLDSAETIESPIEGRRDLVVAEYLYESIIRAQSIGDKESPGQHGKPQRRSSGAIIFKFNTVWEFMHDSPDKIKRPELVNLLKEIGCKDDQNWVDGHHLRFKLIDRDGLRELETMIGLAKELRKNPDTVDQTFKLTNAIGKTAADDKISAPAEGNGNSR